MTTQSGTAAKILVVDDDPSMLQLLSMRLGALGYHAQCCTSGREALASLRRNLPDVVVTDLRMEPMDGMMLFTQIQQQWPNIPVVMLTAHGSIREAVKATQQGLFSFLTKPVDNQDRKSTRLNSSHVAISYAVFCLKKKKMKKIGR